MRISHPDKVAPESGQSVSATRGDLRHPRAHLFWRAGRGQYALTFNRTGANLPSPLNGDRWVYVMKVTLTAAGRCEELELEVARRDLDQEGFVLVGGWDERP